MKLSLIGMSGSGKGYWSKRLEKKGFLRVSCDVLIEEKLNVLLKTSQLRGIEDVAKWMGQPFDPQYPKAAKQYLDFEKEVMHYVFSFLREYKTEDVVIDTTGSVIYTGKRITSSLQSLTKVIYLETPQSVRDEMYRLYIQEPKPVIWGDAFVKQKGEKNEDALKRCYPKLLASRATAYEKLADIRMDYHRLRERSFDSDIFLEEVRA